MPEAEPFAAAFARGPDETDEAYLDRVATAFEELAKKLGPGTGKQPMVPEDDFSAYEFDETP